MTGDRAALAEALRPELPSIAEDVIAAIRAEVADYARPLTGAFGANVRTGVELALGRFLEEFAGAAPALGPPGAARGVYVGLGRGEFREGRSLDALLSAYRTGARLSWRRFVDVGREAGVEPDVLYEVGEAMFAYIDGLSAESTEGYAAAQSAAAGERARERRRLLALLLGDPPADDWVLRAAAEGAGWPLPQAVAALAATGDDADVVAGRLGPEALAVEDEAGVLVLLGDPDAPGRRDRLRRALADRQAALGPAVAPAEAALSARRARLGLRLLTEGRLDDALVVCDEHLPELVLHADPRLAADLAAAALAPLAGLGAGPQAKLTATLRAWLDHQGRVEPTAAALGVHPQTVRYRVGQLREAFGPRLEDPRARLALGLALRV